METKEQQQNSRQCYPNQIDHQIKVEPHPSNLSILLLLPAFNSEVTLSLNKESWMTSVNVTEINSRDISAV